MPVTIMLTDELVNDILYIDSSAEAGGVHWGDAWESLVKKAREVKVNTDTKLARTKAEDDAQTTGLKGEATCRVD